MLRAADKIVFCKEVEAAKLAIKCATFVRFAAVLNELREGSVIRSNSCGLERIRERFNERRKNGCGSTFGGFGIR